jgi:branched-chain amino acid transport system permease protein
VLITAIGVSLFLQNVGQLEWMFGTRPDRMPTLLPDTVLFKIGGGVPVRLVDAMVIATAVLLMLVLDWLVFRTKIGRAMRAVSFSPPNASLMGIDVDRVISFTFVLGAALAAAAGFLMGQKYPGLNQTAAAGWVLLGLKAFVAAVIGGIGNIRGAMLGGLLIGLLEFFVAQYVPDGASLRDIVVFGVLILVLLFKPSGLLGKAVTEKV